MKKILFICLSVFFSNYIFSASYKITSSSAVVVTPSNATLSTTLKKDDQVKFFIIVKKWDGNDYTISATSGTAWINIGTVLEGITLYDDGLAVHGDTKAVDGIYSTILTIPEGISVTNGEVKAYFVSKDSVSATNDGYPFDDTSQSNDIYISIDSVKPDIANVSFSPSPYNPENGYLNISFTLTESADITVEIYKTSYTPTNLVKILSPPPASFGDNMIQWDGYADNGEQVGTRQNGVINDSRTYPDGSYQCIIKAVDSTGNQSDTIISNFKVSTVYVEVSEFTIAPNPVTPDDDNVNDYPVYYVKMKLIGSSAMLSNLGFDVTTNNMSNKPYALIAINMYSSDGTVFDTLETDLTSDYDSDQFPNGTPNYVTNTELGDSGYTDYGDDTTSNDWDVLVPFDSSGTNEYEANFSVRFIFCSKPPNGTYIIRTQFELVAAKWTLKSSGYGDLDGDGVSEYYEKWNEEPDYWHYGLLSPPKSGVLIVEESTAEPLDTTAPTIVSVSPGEGSTKDPGDVSEVYAVLDDGAGGVGVDLINSDIYLEGPSGNKIDGTKTNDGNSTIKWVLTSSLSESGTYTIVVEAVDKRGNTTGEKTYTFTVVDTQPPQIIATSPSPLDGETFDYGTITQFSITLSDSGSGVDWTKSYITLTKDGVAVSGTSSRESSSSNNLIFTPSTLPLESGSYTLQVVAYDNDGNTQSPPPSYSFTITSAGSTEVQYNGDIYLTIPSGTTAYSDGIPVSVSNVSASGSTTPTGWDTSYLGYISPVIQFSPSSLSFSKSVTLTMHYTDSDVSNLPSGITETDLKIYGYSNGSWSSLDGTVSSSNNTVTLTISASTTLADYYVIGYTKPSTTIKFEDSVKAYPQPVKSGSVTFSYRISEDAKITLKIYNLKGEEIYSDIYNEVAQGSTDSTKPWNLKDKDGNKVSPGIYLYKITAEYSDGDSVFTTGKVVVLK